jgi:hypothetical protein
LQRANNHSHYGAQGHCLWSISRLTMKNMLDERGGQRTRWGRNPEYILTGIIRCARCGQPYSPASNRKGTREYRYYRCSTRDKRGRDACPAAPLPAQAIEEFVVARVRDALADGTLAADVTQAVKERLAGQRAALVAERQELPAQIAVLSSEGKRVVDLASNVTGTGRRLLDTKLQDVGDQLGRLEARLREVERRICLLDDCEVEAEWVARCLTDFDRVWDTLSASNRGRLVRAVFERVEVDEPSGDVRVFAANLNASPAAPVRAIAVNS